MSDSIQSYADQFNSTRLREKSAIVKKLESDALSLVAMMAQESLDPELYDAFCAAHDRIIENRHLPNEMLG